ncbi:small highly charged protein [Shewanella sp. JM162201]|uniref:Small highly charged protein n=1 Tax=Shewanella jiangmenensis TaxID=2837387 RepID=A0ABS5V2N6_9GAMM|nr:small highly charged protein [Shewanella jiangmenensis]MBT1444711.1 small highly charged protein [Shewanella jiangmenensis]
MSHSYDFDDDDLPWSDQVKDKQKHKRVKQRRRDTKRRNNDEHVELEYLQTKWR